MAISFTIIVRQMTDGFSLSAFAISHFGKPRVVAFQAEAVAAET